MKTRSLTFRAAAVAALVCALLAQNLSLFAGPSNDTASAASTNSSVKVESNFAVQAPFVEPSVPEAVFVMPKGPADGKDPFFPKSTSPYGEAPKATKTGPAPVVAELILRGISGSDEKPLAIINTTTFGTGDELDVTTKAGKLRIRCLEINKAEGTALVQLGAEKRLLRLPPAPSVPVPK